MAKQGDYTLSELRRLKAGWIQEAGERSAPEAIRRIVLNVGQRCEAELPSYWRGDPAWKLVIGDIVARLFRRSGGFVPAAGEFARTETLVVQVGEAVVCRWKFGNHQMDQDNNLFVPGEWEPALLSLAPEADDRAKADAVRRQETERRELLSELLIGMEV